MAELLTYNLIIIGSSGTGKTTLAHRFISGTFLTHRITIGCEVSSKIILLNDGTEIFIWDTAGMEQNRSSMVKSFYRKADAAIFVYDVSSEESFSDIPSWFQDCMESADENVITVLLGNKCDQDRVVSCRKAQLFAGEHDMTVPQTEGEWRTIAREFHERWNFPHCLGAIDGKHVEIVPPPNSGSYYFNYKNRHSMVLMVIVDAKYKFLLFDFGTNGRVSDGGVFLNTKFYEKLENNDLNIPEQEKLSDSSRTLPYVFVADDAFPLRKDMMKPFRQNDWDSRVKKVYNYRTSRARRIVENAFGILAARFRIYRTQINMLPKNIESVVRATCVLHNYLMTTSLCSYASSDSFDRGNFEDGTTSSGLTTIRSTLEPLQRTRQGDSERTAKQIRNEFMSYFVNEGKVSWQENFIH